jgi:hypothetical protein
MTEVIVSTPQGNMPGSTLSIQAQKKVELPALRRVSIVDLDGPLGVFLSEALCFVAPSAYNPGNWKGKLATFITSRTASFIICGRCVGLATLVPDPMGGGNEAHGMFILAAEGGIEDDIITILRAQKQWARDLGVGFRPPLKEYSSLSQSRIAQVLKAEKREELWIPPLKK